jgi:hypothetical protein
MVEDLAEAYPEAAPYIQEAVEEHGEDWVVEHYYPRIAQLGVLMDVPDVEELPFYDPERHDVPSEAERIEQATAMGQYRENLRTGHKPGEGG